MKTEYIHMDFNAARQLKWERGVSEYRKRASDPFNGEHCEEAWQECLDLFNIIEDMEKTYVLNMSVSKGMVQQIANTLKAQHRRLSGR